MLRKFLERRAEKRRIFRSLLSDTLVRMLGEAGELAIDRKLLSALGATRKELFRVVYSLAIKEQMHILAGKDGIVRLLTNKRFIEMTHNSAFPGKAQSHVSSGMETVAPLSVVDPESEALILDETVVIEPAPVQPVRKPSSDRTPLPETVPAGNAESQEEWAGFVVKDSRGQQGILPDVRKSLPPRERDPWPVFDASDLSSLDAVKKK